jgi:hypothetical protein
MTRPKSMQHPKVGEIVIVKEDQKPRNTWKTPRQKRNAAAAATLRIRDIAEDEQEL